MRDLIRREPRRMLQNLWDEFTDWADFFAPQSTREWGPAVDVKETDNRYVLEADLPGLTEDDVDVRIDGDTLILSSEKQEERKEEREGFLRKERFSRSFQRNFRLPEDVDIDNIDAKFEKGVLTLELPRTGERQSTSRKIDIKKS